MVEINLDNQIVEDLFKDSERGIRCQHIKKDEKGAYCGKDLKEREEIQETRRMICDVYSLQIWCLTDNYKRCIYYQGEQI